jgi:Uma2 family endonuclease
MTSILSDFQVDYHAHTGNYQDFDLSERIDGITYMAPAPSRRHQQISMAITRQLLAVIDYRRVLYAPHDLLLSVNNRVQPDILVYRNLTALEEEEIPLVLFEIISPASKDHDRIRKFKLYEKHGIAEYWLVDPENHTIEVYALVNGAYHLFATSAKGDEVVSKVLDGFRLSVMDVLD